jgi:hypothetical protein
MLASDQTRASDPMSALTHQIPLKPEHAYSTVARHSG